MIGGLAEMKREDFTTEDTEHTEKIKRDLRIQK